MSAKARHAKKQRREERRHFKHHGWCNDDNDYYDDDPSWDCCWRCAGDGYIDGAEMAEQDPLWYDAEDVYTCNCCGGSGNADDCTYW